MDNSTGPILGGTGIALSVLTMIYTAINHKRIRAKCCGRNLEIQIDIDPTTGNRNSVKVQPQQTSSSSSEPQIVVEK